MNIQLLNKLLKNAKTLMDFSLNIITKYVYIYI